MPPASPHKIKRLFGLFKNVTKNYAMCKR